MLTVATVAAFGAGAAAHRAVLRGFGLAIPVMHVQHSISEFSSVSCSTTQFNIGCNAVGFVTKNGVSLPMAENWNGSTWAVKPVPSPDPKVTRSTMSGVSCPTLITCMGVGFYDTSGAVIEGPLGEQYG
jgi:hypothetical protein